ncbi:AraC family transcriptional regulator [Kordia sp. YSTF-M3]|uniref:AraC family transcriptional regulator n=1 Tax=Kordia aestuariivivens TaxID=2759037 RepID=A0ABR7QD68_9FLAO|nr:AraC family transcriptional regulator [Kordia aestuariivivens]MBC8756485.1 AraC family transcriptional regulator [Kordia aestuariivivens]
MIVLIILYISSCNQKQETAIDEVTRKEYGEIYKLLQEATTIEQKIYYGEQYLEKAKNDKQATDSTNIIVGYRILSVTHTDENVLAYSDSIIALTKNNSSIHYPAIAYEKKGDFYYGKHAYQRALDNYLQFFEYAQKHDQKDMISRANYNIGTVKRRTGNIKEALELYRQNYAYTQKNKEAVNTITYFNSIAALANIFNDNKTVDSANHYNKIGHREAIRLKNESYKNHFAFNEGVTNYHKKNYQIAIDSIQKYTPYFENIHDDDKLVFVYYYSGKAHAGLNQPEKAINFFKKVDSIFQKTYSIFPITREAYIQLDTYYKNKNDLKNQLIYKNQLMKVDSILKADELYLNKAIFKEYDIPKLKAEKENLREEKQQQGNRFKKAIIGLFVLILFLLIGFGIQYRKRKTYQRRFEEVINEKKPKKSSKSLASDEQKIAIPIDIVNDILQKLEAFEHENKFISNQTTLNDLPKGLHTNPNYLSKVVNHYKKCSFSTYINNLRIEYTIEQLKTNPTYLKYTVKAIAAEVGFNNVQSFSKAFFNAKGINPSYFIRKLKKISSSA